MTKRVVLGVAMAAVVAFGVVGFAVQSVSWGAALRAALAVLMAVGRWVL